MEEKVINATSPTTEALKAPELHVVCGNCGQNLGTYTPPCNRHKLRCLNCKADLEIRVSSNKDKVSTIMCIVLSTKETRAAG